MKTTVPHTAALELELIAVLLAISRVSERMAQNLRTMTTHRQLIQGGQTHE